MEHTMASNVIQYLTKYNKLSAETQLTGFMEDMLRGMKYGKQSDMVVMDFAKVFKVWHTRLLHKLHMYGIDPGWSMSFFLVQNAAGGTRQRIIGGGGSYLWGTTGLSSLSTFS